MIKNTLFPLVVLFVVFIILGTALPEYRDSQSLKHTIEGENSSILPVVTIPSANIVGIYDPHQTFSGRSTIQVEQVFLPWRLDNAKEVINAIHRLRSEHRFPIIALEPWPFNWNGMTKATLFSDIVNGKYDSSIRTIFQAIGQEAPQEIWIRWGHEMELSNVFEWGQSDPQAFIAAYRHVVTLGRLYAKGNVKFIWSPAGGNDVLHQYWPGSEYVDIIGLTYLELKPSKGARSFDAGFNPRYKHI